MWGFGVVRVFVYGEWGYLEGIEVLYRRRRKSSSLNLEFFVGFI